MNTTTEKQPFFSNPARWVSWLIGAALFSAVLIVAFHFSEEREFLEMGSRIRPQWMLVAVLLQATTYFVQGEIWRRIARTAKADIPRWIAYKLSLIKLFVDQALPTSGLSGTIVVAKGLEARGMSRAMVLAGVLINTASFCGSYAIGLIAMLLIQGHRVNRTIAVVSVFFIWSLTALSILIPRLAGKQPSEKLKARLKFVRNLWSFLEEADPQIARNKRLFIQSTGLQIGTILLDASTMWILIRSFGTDVNGAKVFASFMFASLVRSAGIVPGGLGTFEATSVWTLHQAGISASIALTATLIFRGLSFWLPMIPGFWLSRRMMPKRTILSKGGPEE